MTMSLHHFLTQDGLSERALWPCPQLGAEDNIAEAVHRFTAATQTVGIDPDSLRVKWRDKVVLNGGQRVVQVGDAISGTIGGSSIRITILR